MLYKFKDGVTALDVYNFLKVETEKLDFKNPFDVCKYNLMITNLFPVLNTPYLILDQSQKVLTRARKHINNGMLFANIRELLCVPKHLTTVNRGNVPGEPIYYCSNDPGTSIYEIRPNPGCWVTTLQLNFNIDKVKLLALGLDKSKKLIGTITEKDRGLHLFLEEHFGKQVEEPHDYYQTAIVVRGLLKKNETGIIYPSVGSNKLGNNIALKKGIMDNPRNWDFRFATVQEVISITDRYDLTVRCLYEAKSIDEYGNFKWEPVLDCIKGHKIDSSIYHT